MVSKVDRKRKNQIRTKAVNYKFLILLVILPLILYWKIISYQFTGLDDRQIIGNSYGFLSDFKNVIKAFEKDNFMSNDGKGYYRPVQTISFMIDAHLGDEKPNVYHFSNILYHILTVIVLFFLLRKIGVRDNISFYISLLFSVHPLFTDAIAWIPGRGDILAGLFCSVSFLTYLYYCETKNKLFFVFHSVSLFLALFSKEISVFLPVLIIIYYRFLQRNRYKTSEWFYFIIAWSFSICLFFFLRHTYLNSQELPSFKFFISNLPIIPIFLSKLIIPLGLSGMPLYDHLFSVIGLIIFLLSIVYIWRVKVGNKFLIIFGVVWFLGFIIPPMFVALSFTKVHSDYLECRAYLPAVGIFITLGVLLNEIIKGKGDNILIKSFVPVIIIFSIISYTYSDDFANGVTFYSSLIKLNPNNANALSQRGSEYLISKNYDLALADFDNSINADPTVSDPYFNKGLIYHFMNDHVSSEHFLSMALKYDTLYPESGNLHELAYLNFSSEKLNLKKYDEIKVLLKRGITRYPDICGLHNNLGLTYYATASYDSALSEYDKAIQIKGNDYSYFNNRGMAKIMLNDNEGAIIDFTKALNIRQDIGEIWYNRSLAFSKLNKAENASEDRETARRLGYKEVP
jgi:protein O-mannosyl-transferase